ncbi:hypothetical protein AGMMS49944_09580 [Spirochaetia bacterium]|nr:hypothetical protein AGMMS49944_09580 [Spirochaetia bacterium]
MPKNPEEFLYMYSEILKQEIALSKKSGWAYSQDKGPDGKFVSYSPKEIQLITGGGGVLSPQIHRIKKLFGGEVIANDRTGTMDGGKPKTGNESISPDNIFNPDRQIPQAPGGGPESGDGELELY